MERIQVPFAGGGAGEGELSWGQRDIWLAMCEQHTSLGLGGAFPVPAGKTTADVAADLSYLVSRHPSLRTRLRFGDDDAMPRQAVAEAGEVPLVVVEAAVGEDPAAVAAGLYQRYHATNFDYAREWPIRWAVVTRDGLPAYLVTEICHLAMDGRGALALLADLEGRGASPVPPPVTGTPPLAQAAWQGSEGGRRQRESALRYWERLLRAIPPRRYPPSSGERAPRYADARFASSAGWLAVQRIVARTGASTSTVLLAAAAVSFAQVTGIHPAVLQVEVDNRFRRGFATTVSPVGQSGLCAIDVARVTFDEVVARAFRAAIGAYKYGYYDPVELEALIARVGQDRGEEIDLSCYVNDRRLKTRDTRPALLPSEAEIRAALPRSALTWGPPLTEPNGRCFLHINDVPGVFDCQLYADTHYLAPDHMAAYLRGMEAAVVRAALDPAAVACASEDGLAGGVTDDRPAAMDPVATDPAAVGRGAMDLGATVPAARGSGDAG